MPIHGREVKQIIKQRGFEQGVIYCLESLADEISNQNQSLRECAQTIDALAKLSTTVAMITDGVEQRIDSMQGRDIDAPEVINPHDLHQDEGVDTDPDRRREHED